MIKFLIIVVSVFFAGDALAQNPCYIKYTYDASGNRIKREYICAPVDTIINLPSGGGGGNARQAQYTSMQPVGDSVDFYVSPNPAAQFISITLVGKYDNVQGVILNASGAMVERITIIDRITQIDIAKLSAGQYTVALVINNRRLVKKFVKHA
jgi:hypothetical protein